MDNLTRYLVAALLLVWSTPNFVLGQVIMTGHHRQVGVTSCVGIPSYILQFKGTTPSPGTVSSWADTSGNSNFATFVSGPTAGISDPTPNNTQTVVFSGSQSIGTLTNPVASGSPVSVCAAYKIASFSIKQLFTGSHISTGADAYYGNAGLSPQTQGMDSGFLAVVGSGTTTTTMTWVDTCVSYANTGALAFYRNGSTDGSTTSSVSVNGIDAVFGDLTDTAPQMTVAELDVMNFAINSTQYTAIHNCYVSLYGVA